MAVRSIVLAGGIVFVAAIAYVFTGSREVPFVVVADKPLLAAPSTSPPTAVEPVKSVRSAPANADRWSPEDLPVVVAQRFRDAIDKRAFFDHAVEVGGGAHLHFALEALQRCGVVNEYGMAGAEQDMAARISLADPAQARRIEAYRAFIKGCEGFALRHVGRQEEVAIMRRLYESPDAMGKAYNLKPYPDTASEYDDTRATAVELLETADPYLLQLIVPYLAARRGGKLTWAQFTASDPAIQAANREEAAWGWALCELGLDCAAAGMYGNFQCFAIGKCDWKALDEVALPVFVTGGAAPSKSRKDEIVAAVRAKDWTKLGL